MQGGEWVRATRKGRAGAQQEPSQSSCPLQTPLLPVAPLLTGHASFLSPGSSPPSARLLPVPPAQYLLWLAAPLFLREGSGLLLFEDWAIVGVWVLAFASSVCFFSP